MAEAYVNTLAAGDILLSPEMAINPEAHLAELFSASAEVIETQRPKLWSGVETALATCIDQHDQQAMRLTGQLLDWQLFGKPGDPLPMGLAIGYSQNGSTRFAYNERLGFRGACHSEATKRLEEYGLADITRTVWQEIESRQDQIYQTIGEVIKGTAAYHFVQAFDTPQPPQPEEQPLTPFFRQIRERQVIDDTARRFGIDGVIQPGTMASIALKRAMQHLDEETMSRKMPELDTDALQKARDYFTPKVAQKLNCDPGSFLGIICNDEGLVYALVKDDPTDPNDLGAETDVNDYFHDVAEDTAKELNGVNSKAAYHITKEFMMAYLDMLLDPRTSTNHEVLVDMAIKRAATDILEYYELTPTGYTDSYDLHKPLSLYLRAPSGGVRISNSELSQLSRPHYKRHEQQSDRLGFTTRDELLKKQQTIIGETLRRPSEDTANRLIQSQLRNPSVPSRAFRADLRIRLGGAVFDNSDPYIPGYMLVGRSGQEFSFTRDGVDPYVAADIPIHKAAKVSLAQIYEEMGLTSLAKHLHISRGLTVQELTELIRSSSYYALPAKTSHSYEESNELPSSFEAATLESLSFLVSNDTLQAQCNVSAMFLKLSLQHLFGQGTAGIVGGYSLRDRISEAGHAQTSFVHNDHVYVLDATPSSNLLPDRSRFGIRRKGRMILPPQTAKLQKQVAYKDQSEDEWPTITSQELQKQQLSSLQMALEMQLTALFQVTDRQALLEHIARLSTDDPINRTFEITARASQEQIDPNELEQLIAYIKGYAKAPAELLSQMRVPGYDGRILETLNENLREILSVIWRSSD
ncbi:MAG TPA: hypothetical protein VLH38_00035 [Patescibacteria group bacterium]|nr:hypothetical protein [Patescibacteria group bacterium]